MERKARHFLEEIVINAKARFYDELLNKMYSLSLTHDEYKAIKEELRKLLNME